MKYLKLYRNFLFEYKQKILNLEWNNFLSEKKDTQYTDNLFKKKLKK